MTSIQETAVRLEIPAYHRFRAGIEARSFDVETQLEMLVEDRLLQERNLRGRVLDIGTGQGGSYKALTKYSDDITTIEPREEIAHLLISDGIVPENRLIVPQDGDWLSGVSGKFDLITALHLFGGDYDIPVQDLHQRLVQLLSPGGQLMYTAQPDQLASVRYDMLFGDLPLIMGTLPITIKGYGVGPDNTILILTNNMTRN